MDYRDIVKSMIGMGIIGPSLAINNLCSFSCKHCYILDGKDFLKRGKKFSLRRTLDIVRDFKDITPMLSIAAMEPFLTKESREICFVIIKEIEQWNNKPKFGIISNLSNAHLLSPEEIKVLNKVNYLAFSLEGGNPEINDIIRGRGSFNKTIKGMEYLLKNNFPNNKLIIEGTIHKPEFNIPINEQVNSLINFAEKHKICKVAVNIYCDPDPKNKKTKEYYFKLIKNIIKVLEDIKDKKQIEFILYTTYEVPEAVKAAKTYLDSLEIDISNSELNALDASFIVDLPNCKGITGKIGLAFWPMEEVIAPRIATAENDNPLKIKDRDYDTGSSITHCFGYQKDNAPVGYWIPDLYQKINKLFIEKGDEIVDNILEEGEYTFCSDMTEDEYIDIVTKRMVQKCLQRVKVVSEIYKKL